MAPKVYWKRKDKDEDVDKREVLAWMAVGPGPGRDVPERGGGCAGQTGEGALRRVLVPCLVSC